MRRGFDILKIVLLAGILVMLVAIWTRMPPTVAEVAALGREAALRAPFVHAQVTDTITVEVENTPLEVEINR